jgi:hypothetical protein
VHGDALQALARQDRLDARRWRRQPPSLVQPFAARVAHVPNCEAMRMGLRRPVNRAAAVVAAALLLATLPGCSGGSQEAPAAGGGAGGSPSAALDLRAAGCPAKIVIQDAWWPSMSDGVLYALLGRDLSIDADAKRVTGPLVARGKPTGVQLEVRAGGPAIGFQQTSARMYADRAITLGKVASFDEVLQQSGRLPTLAVFAALERDPQMIMWDPQTYPQFTSIEDIGQTDTKVLFFDGDAYMEYLLATGKLKRSQVDGSFDGDPARFVAARGRVAQSGFATHDPYIYQHVLQKQWGRPVKYQLVYDTGYPNYGSPLAIRRGDRERLAPCLRRLVPVIQQAQADMMARPDQTIATVVRLSDAFKASTPTTADSEAFSVSQMKNLGLVGNGPDKTMGDFDPQRVQRLIDITRPIFAARNKPPKENLQPADVVTNEFIDQAIGLAA